MQDYLTSREAAKYLNISLKLFSSLVRQGLIRFTQIGRRSRRFNKVGLDAFVESRTQGGVK